MLLPSWEEVGSKQQMDVGTALRECNNILRTGVCLQVVYRDDWPFTTGRMYESEGEVVPEETDDDVAADLRNARALEYLRTAAETAVLCGSYLVTGENHLQYA